LTAAGNPRVSGILLHPTSLPGPYGIGELGHEATALLDFLAGAEQRLWQVLPLGPTGTATRRTSASPRFAGNRSS
jgi:4-alpha-glucanotransferase